MNLTLALGETKVGVFVVVVEVAVRSISRCHGEALDLLRGQCLLLMKQPISEATARRTFLFLILVVVVKVKAGRFVGANRRSRAA